MRRLQWWMRVAGALYLLQAVIAAIVLLPIRVLGPAGTLARAAAGEPTAKLLVDTWVLFGLEVAVVGAALLLASRVPAQASVLVATVLGLELVRGIGHDIYMMVRDYDATPFVVWIVIHTVLIVTGLVFLRRAESPGLSAPADARTS